MREQVSKLPRWESELWHYMSSSSGDCCPIYSRCQGRLRGGWCISDHKEHLEKLLDSSQFHPSNYDFIEHVTPGRIFSLVERLAQSILRKGRVYSPPVPSELVFLADEQLPVEIRLVPLRVRRGAVWHLQDAWVIQLNENDPLGRRRFTLFHELFHILVLAHCSDTPVFRRRGSEAGNFSELLAEHFASCILMPRGWVVERWAEVSDLCRMVAIFGTTERDMWVRLKILRLANNLTLF